MKFYSEVTKKYYDTERECLQEEQKVVEEQNRQKTLRERAAQELKEKQEKLAAERKARAQEVEAARKEMLEAREKYSKLLTDFTKDYHTYHLTLTGDDAKKSAPTLFDLFSPFFDF